MGQLIAAVPEFAKNLALFMFLIFCGVMILPVLPMLIGRRRCSTCPIRRGSHICKAYCGVDREEL